MAAVQTGSNRFLVVLNQFSSVSVRFFLYFQTRQPVAVPVHQKKAKKPDWTGPLKASVEGEVNKDGIVVQYLGVKQATKNSTKQARALKITQLY